MINTSRKTNKVEDRNNNFLNCIRVLVIFVNHNKNTYLILFENDINTYAN